MRTLQRESIDTYELTRLEISNETLGIPFFSFSYSCIYSAYLLFVIRRVLDLVSREEKKGGERRPKTDGVSAREAPLATNVKKFTPLPRDS
jgi:hypothetical protein